MRENRENAAGLKRGLAGKNPKKRVKNLKKTAHNY